MGDVNIELYALVKLSNRLLDYRGSDEFFFYQNPIATIKNNVVVAKLDQN